MAWRHLTDTQWEAIRPQLPPVKPRPRGGRPRVDDRRGFEGILWILWTGAPWSEMPKPAGAGCKEWEERGSFLALWRAFLNTLNDRPALDHLHLCIARDLNFARAATDRKV